MLIYISTILAHIAYNMYVEIKNNYVLSKLKPKQLVLEYHKMTTIIQTLDESRKRFESVIDEKNKKIDENHNNLQI